MAQEAPAIKVHQEQRVPSRIPGGDNEESNLSRGKKKEHGGEPGQTKANLSTYRLSPAFSLGLLAILSRSRGSSGRSGGIVGREAVFGLEAGAGRLWRAFVDSVLLVDGHLICHASCAEMHLRRLENPG